MSAHCPRCCPSATPKPWADQGTAERCITAVGLALTAWAIWKAVRR